MFALGMLVSVFNNKSSVASGAAPSRKIPGIIPYDCKPVYTDTVSVGNKISIKKKMLL